MKIIHVVVLVVGFLFIRGLHAEELPASVVQACTTNIKIYFTTRLQTNPGMTKGQKRTAILKALGASTSEPNFAVQNFKGQWFYEYESGDAIYTGYKIRSHYLSVAVVFTDKGLNTVVCNSSNLRQSEKSIHRKAPLWKETLDTKIRVQVADISLSKQASNADLDRLNALHANGFVTQEEYENIKNRIKDN